MNEYLLFYKERLSPTGDWHRRWDVFVAAHNSSERVRLIARYAKARERHWLILPEYGYLPEDYPDEGVVYVGPADDEAEYVSNFVRQLGNLTGRRIVIDITGFISHYVLVLLALLRRAGVTRCDVLYGEPTRYLQSERTAFSDQAVMAVRQIAGFEGVHTTETHDDLLILAIGYDYRVAGEVANNKEHARKIQLFGLPSLRPDMYQQSLLQASRISEAVGPDASSPQHYKYAPASDPFVTASVLSSLVEEHREQFPHSNVYMSPLSTKAQALGMAVFYLRECRDTATSIVYPFCRSYMRETSEGLEGVWLYRVEL